jgi:RNA polymerase sigma factor (sigma-70 family)
LTQSTVYSSERRKRHGEVRGSGVQGLARAQLPITSATDAGQDGAHESAALEADFVARAVHDPQAFALLYRRYLNPIYRYCFHRLGDKEAAEDATSQVFAKALAALPTYRADRPFRAWLFAIAHNVIIDAHRARRPHEPLEAAAHVVDAASSPEDAALAAEASRTVQTLLAELTPDQARVVELRLAGLREVEIARVLDRRPGAVRAVQFRALVKLRALLGTVPGSKGLTDV